MSITVDMTKEEIFEYLKNKFKIELKQEFKKKEFDGESLVLLRIIDLKPKEIGIEPKYKSTIIRNLEKDFLKLKNNIDQDKFYSEINKGDINNIWSSLDEKLQKLKLGEKLKFIKYLFIKDPPHDIKSKEKNLIYLKSFKIGRFYH